MGSNVSLPGVPQAAKIISVLERELPKSPGPVPPNKIHIQKCKKQQKTQIQKTKIHKIKTEQKKFQSRKSLDLLAEAEGRGSGPFRLPKKFLQEKQNQK